MYPTKFEISGLLGYFFNKTSKDIPIIIYCYHDKCDAAEIVLKRLNKIGFNNIVHYKNGIKAWKGPAESK